MFRFKKKITKNSSYLTDMPIPTCLSYHYKCILTLILPFLKLGTEWVQDKSAYYFSFNKMDSNF